MSVCWAKFFHTKTMVICLPDSETKFSLTLSDRLNCVDFHSAKVLYNFGLTRTAHWVTCILKRTCGANESGRASQAPVLALCARVPGPKDKRLCVCVHLTSQARLTDPEESYLWRIQ